MLICNKSKECNSRLTCPHSIPHEQKQIKDYPQCASPGTYCYAENMPVICVEVKDSKDE